MINSITLVGRLSDTPQVEKSKENGNLYLRGTIVLARPNSKDGMFVNFVSFGKTAELIGNHIGKGDIFGIVGKYDIEKYENAHGKGKKHTVIVNSVSLFPNNRAESTQEKVKPKQKSEEKIDYLDSFL